MSKRSCGHDYEQSDSVLLCFPCAEAEEQRTKDAVWNAAIEAAAKEIEEGSPKTDDSGRLLSTSDRVRALKREAK